MINRKEFFPSLRHAIDTVLPSYSPLTTGIETMGEASQTHDPLITHEEIEAQLNAYNEQVKSHNGNGTGEMLYKFADPESLSEHPFLTPVSEQLLIHNGRAPIDIVAENTGLPVEEIIELPHHMTNVIEIEQNEEGVLEISSPPLIEYMEEKRELLAEKGIVFEDKSTQS